MTVEVAPRGVCQLVPAAWRPRDPHAIARQVEEIRALARESNALLLAHNYQLPEVQEAADFVGDSLGLALRAESTDADSIVSCGVHFMAESARILNPDKTVLLPNLSAGCALADSIAVESLLDWKGRYPEHAVVTYVNSSAEVKALSEICCTSANAAAAVRSLRNDKILFTPHRNLGRWVARQVPEKEIVVYDGACPRHDVLRGLDVEALRARSSEAVVIAHSECWGGRPRPGRRDLLDHRDARGGGAPPRGPDLHHRDRVGPPAPAQKAPPRP